MKKIVFGGGCFWGVEAYFKSIPGVTGTKVGYANGTVKYPTYQEVCKGGTGHAEVVEITYDPGIVTLDTLLDSFWKIIDPTLLNQQGPDVGTQYRTGVYFSDPGDQAVIRASLDQEQKKYQESIVTEVMPLKNFYDAEEYHQDYLAKNPGGYCHIDLTNR